MTALRYRTVLLDAGETILGPRSSFGTIYAEVFAARGVSIPGERWEQGLRMTWAEVNRTIPAGVDRYGYWPGGEAEYWRRFVEGTLARTPGAPRDPGLAASVLEPLREAFRHPRAWEVYEEVVPVLERLRGMGAHLAVVSNWDSRLPSLLEQLDLARHFEVIVVSHLEGMEKPSPELFLRAVRRLGGRADDALHVGDVPELDGAGARAAGIASAILDRRGRLAPGTATMRDLTPLPDLLVRR